MPSRSVPRWGSLHFADKLVCKGKNTRLPRLLAYPSLISPFCLQICKHKRGPAVTLNSGFYWTRGPGYTTHRYVNMSKKRKAEPDAADPARRVGLTFEDMSGGTFLFGRDDGAYMVYRTGAVGDGVHQVLEVWHQHISIDSPSANRATRHMLYIVYAKRNTSPPSSPAPPSPAQSSAPSTPALPGSPAQPTSPPAPSTPYNYEAYSSPLSSSPPTPDYAYRSEPESPAFVPPPAPESALETLDQFGWMNSLPDLNDASLLADLQSSMPDIPFFFMVDSSVQTTEMSHADAPHPK
eukprot:TRINITY_DN9575_c0_g1_i2.p1 TRINITY_DN9575_c0_g1~~TRINITY_DN9575_c0_g1_i2.p1  ORF type:complete len:294 (+),score=54.68 TRINITY_DN9575_c0_g1_i2:259-1140(+)